MYVLIIKYIAKIIKFYILIILFWINNNYILNNHFMKLEIINNCCLINISLITVKNIY
jgi:hypothetical protein